MLTIKISYTTDIHRFDENNDNNTNNIVNKEKHQDTDSFMILDKKRTLSLNLGTPSCA